jgi:excisionase family DNA binding protein
LQPPSVAKIPVSELTEVGRLFRGEAPATREDERRQRGRTRRRRRGVRVRVRVPSDEQPRDDELLTPSEVAEVLGVNARAVSRWARDGLPCIHTLGGHRRFRWTDVRAWIVASRD